MPKLQAVPNPAGGGSATHRTEVVNVHTKLAANALPNWSCAPVVIVAVKVVLGVRLAAGGVKVAIMSVGSRETVPVTLPLGPLKVNVVVLIVAGFIALLNVAVTIAMLGQTTELPFAGVTVVTVGGVKGAPGFPVPTSLSGSLHPAITTANRNVGIKTLLTFNLRISFSSSPSYEAFYAAHSGPEICETPSFTGCLTTFRRKIGRSE
jgi:hypothetical protein